MVDPAAINEERLRLLGQRLANLPQVQTVRPFPREKPDRLVVHFHARQYPVPIEDVRLELRLRLSGDFNFVYIEVWDDEQWRCRWDRHHNPHNTRDHFHPPPMITTRDAVDRDFPEEIDDVLGKILSFVETRQQTLWTGELVYPENYDFSEDEFR